MAAGVRTRQKEGELSKPTRYYSNRQERQVAQAVGGRQTANSGATPFQKGDILTNNMLLECKTRTSPSESISIKKEWLVKNESDRVFMGKKYSAIAFNFGPDENNYYVIDEFLFQDLLDYLNMKDD